ncbi:hypothetical protein EVAR_46517_1 [Eumeta japonica]|uniref:Uncharacterized protein n=1 Tax=Eumeta variegata TaxID=151549 RepID=A0A4C1WSC9_EUMVA|nr:hypothetical protein EVAR_46517_1 [Eumeta japonica]
MTAEREKRGAYEGTAADCARAAGRAARPRLGCAFTLTSNLNFVVSIAKNMRVLEIVYILKSITFEKKDSRGLPAISAPGRSNGSKLARPPGRRRTTRLPMRCRRLRPVI